MNDLMEVGVILDSVDIVLLGGILYQVGKIHGAFTDIKARVEKIEAALFKGELINEH